MSAPLLSVSGLRRRFGGVPAIDDLSFTLDEGTFCGIIGPNGAGKTTLMNLLSGYLRPDAGAIVFAGESMVGLRPYHACRRGIARTFQIVRPFAEMTVLENVIAGALFSRRGGGNERQARGFCLEILDLVGLTPRRDRLAGTLTLGEKKRLEMARSLASRPRLLLLDEVLGGLSDGEITQLLGVLRQVHAAGTTILMIEHVVRALVQLVDRLIVLNFGRLLRDGPPREVLADPVVIGSYLGRPLEGRAVTPRTGAPAEAFDPGRSMSEAGPG